MVTQYTVTGWDQSLAGAYSGMVYWPSMLEFGVALGVIGLAVAILCAGLRFLPLRPAQDE